AQIFSRSGDPARPLTHGLRQLQNWRIWFRENRDYVIRHWPFKGAVHRLGLTEPETVLVISRRTNITDKNRFLYYQIGLDARVQVMTFDRLTNHLHWPAFASDTKLTTCRFVNGSIEESEIVSEMQVRVQWTTKSHPASNGRTNNAAARRLKT